jgi:hypothetical protein
LAAVPAAVPAAQGCSPQNLTQEQNILAAPAVLHQMLVVQAAEQLTRRTPVRGQEVVADGEHLVVMAAVAEELVEVEQ